MQSQNMFGIKFVGFIYQ